MAKNVLAIKYPRYQRLWWLHSFILALSKGKSVKDGTTIFLSSTAVDLEEHRKAVLFALTQLRQWVEAMEYFGALPGEPLDECLKAVRRTDIYIVAIGTRYGSKDDSGISFTQREYDEAFRHNKKIFVYLIDEDNHPVLPRYFDIGTDAEKLIAFKSLLTSRHTIDKFSSPQDLALKVGIAILRYLSLDSTHIEERSKQFAEEMPRLLSEAGYSLGMTSHVIDLSGLLELRNGNELEVRDPAVKAIMVAGYLAVNVSRNNFSVLEDILTFDADLWELFIALVRHYGIDDHALAEFMGRCRDPMLFRLLSVLSGRLGLYVCAEPMCRRLVTNTFSDREFAELHTRAALQVTPLRDVIRNALSSMPTEALPTIERYFEEAKTLKRWPAKRTLESVLRLQRQHIKSSS